MKIGNLMKNPLVSVIIPFYNPDHNFEKLLKSVEEQTYENIEIILIDDGSNEEINALAKNFEKENNKAILITQKNSGVANARQTGVLRAKGDLIIHADADDLVPKEAIEKLVSKQQENDADIVVGSYLVRTSKKDSLVLPPEDITYHGYIEGLLLEKIHGSLCNKLIKKELYEKVQFEPGINYMEDLLLLARILHLKKCNISSIKDVVYIYRQHTNSATAKLSMNSIVAAEKVNRILCDLYQERVHDSTINNLKQRSRAFTILNSAKHKVRVFEESDNKLLKCTEIDWKKRTFLWLIKLNLLWVVRAGYRLRAPFRY